MSFLLVCEGVGEGSGVEGGLGGERERAGGVYIVCVQEVFISHFRVTRKCDVNTFPKSRTHTLSLSPHPHTLTRCAGGVHIAANFVMVAGLPGSGGTHSKKSHI